MITGSFFTSQATDDSTEWTEPIWSESAICREFDAAAGQLL